METDGKENLSYSKGSMQHENGAMATIPPKDGKPEKDSLCMEDIIENLGSFGHWQRVIFFLISVGDVFGAFGMLVPVFTNATPNWWCTGYNGVSTNMTTNLTKDHPHFKQCGNETLECTNFHYDDELTSIVTEWNLVCSKRYINTLVQSLQMVGLFVGAGVFAHLSDRLGRKRAYYVTVVILTAGGVGSAFTQVWWTYGLCRILVGIGYGSYQVINCVYPLEFVGHRWRTLCGTIGFWALGGGLLALFAFYIRNWRYLILVTATSGVAFFVTWWFVPESPRWLVHHGHYDSAHKIVCKIARKNKKPEPDISALYKCARDEKAAELQNRKYNYLDLFLRRRFLKRTLIIIVTWFTAFVMYYELSYNLSNLSGDRYINQLLAGVFDLAGMLVVLFLNNILGRKRCLFMLLSVCLVATVVILVMHVTDSKDTLSGLFVGTALLGKGSALAVTYICQIFTAELYPTVIRNLGVGVGSMAGRIGGVAAPQVLLLGTYFLIAPYFIFMGLCIVTLPLIFFLPETNGVALEDSVEEAGTAETDNASGKSDVDFTRI